MSICIDLILSLWSETHSSVKNSNISKEEKLTFFPAKVFLRPGTQVRRFGRQLNPLDDFFVKSVDANL